MASPVRIRTVGSCVPPAAQTSPNWPDNSQYHSACQFKLDWPPRCRSLWTRQTITANHQDGTGTPENPCGTGPQSPGNSVPPNGCRRDRIASDAICRGYRGTSCRTALTFTFRYGSRWIVVRLNPLPSPHLPGVLPALARLGSNHPAAETEERQPVRERCAEANFRRELTGTLDR